MRILQYEIKNCQKVIIKAQGHILFGSIFNASDVTIGICEIADVDTLILLIHFWNFKDRITYLF